MHERHVHLLLLPGDGRVVSTHPDREEEDDQEDHLRPNREGAHARPGGAQLRSPAPPGRSCQERGDDDQSRAGERRDAEYAGQPGDVGHQQQPEHLGGRIAAIR